MKNYTSGLLLLSVCFVSMPAFSQAEPQFKNSVLVCRARQCAETSYAMSQGFFFNKVDQMMKRNIGKAVLLCEADPVSHVCLSQGLTIPAQTLLENIDIKIDGLKLTDEQLVSGQKALDVVFDYKIRANEIFPKCQLGVSRLTVSAVDKVEMTTDDFVCHITETGRTAINATYNIDYLDFDYGFIGAYYTIGVGETVKGDKTGYVLMRFTDKTPKGEGEIEENIKDQTEQVVSVEVEANLPEILKLTAPTLLPEDEEVVSDTSVSEVEVVQEEQPKTENTPEPVKVKSQETQKPMQKVVKTTIVEKTTILSDGTRKTEEPIKRTIVGDVIQ